MHDWERRLREMVLAGGALAAAACADNAGTPSDAALYGEVEAAMGAYGGCGNANPDPCICGRPEASTTDKLHCDQQIACQAEGGTFDPFTLTTIDGSVQEPHCSFPQDAGPNDAGADGDGSPPSDALPDIVNTFPDVNFCCNANPDPCCQFLHCGGAMTAQCSVELACQADGGTWSEFVQFADGSVGPSCLPGEAGPGDAGGDGHD